MQRMMQYTVVSVMLAAAAPAQFGFPGARGPENAVRQQEIARAEFERYLREVENQESAAEREIAERRAAQYQERDFAEKVNRVAALWNRLFAKYREQHVFDVKDARALSRAFHELEACGWPK